MPGGSALAVGLSLGAGLAGAAQVAVMGRLGERVGSLEAVAFAGAVTAAVTVVALLATRRSIAGYGDAVHAPAWMWLGGLLGAVVVLSITVAGPRIGVLATSGLLIAAQLAAGAVIDRWGLFGLERHAVSSSRLADLALLALGAALVLRR